MFQYNCKIDSSTDRRGIELAYEGIEYFIDKDAN